MTVGEKFSGLASRVGRVRFSWKSPFWLPVVAVVMVSLALIPGESTPDETVGKAREVPMDSVTLACPVQKELEILVGQVAPGESASAKTIPASSLPRTWSQADRWRTGTAEGGALVIHQRGEATGLVGFVAGKARKALGTGLLFSSCPELLDEGWFVGLSDQGKSLFQLANLGSSRAVVDVYWWSQFGPIEGSDSMGVVIEPGATKTIMIGDNVPSEKVVGARIVRRRQQVSAIALSADDANKGTELVLPQPSLSKKSVFTGIPDKGDITLSVLNPHEETVRLSVRGIRTGGVFDVGGLDDVSVKPGTTIELTIPRKAKLNGQAIEVVADRPVAASVTARTPKDIAILAPSGQLAHPSAVPVKMAGNKVQLTLAAPEENAVVALEGVDATMKVKHTRNISIPAGSTVGVDLSSEFKGSTSVVITVKGVAFAGAWMRSGDHIASTALTPAPTTIRVPAVAIR